MREIKGSYAGVKEEIEKQRSTEEYLRVVITDQRISPEISESVRNLCRSRNSIVMALVSEYREYGDVSDVEKRTGEKKSVEEYFEELYKQRNHENEPDEKDQKLFAFVGEQVRHADETEKQCSEPDEGEVDRLLAFIMENYAGGVK